jgi:hypothetical protein
MHAVFQKSELTSAFLIPKLAMLAIFFSKMKRLRTLPKYVRKKHCFNLPNSVSKNKNTKTLLRVSVTVLSTSGFYIHVSSIGKVSGL